MLLRLFYFAMGRSYYALLPGIWDEIKVIAWAVLEFERANLAVTFSFDNHDRGHESLHGEVTLEFGRIPDLSIFGGQSLPLPRIRVQFRLQRTSRLFGGVRVVHGQQYRRGLGRCQQVFRTISL